MSKFYWPKKRNLANKQSWEFSSNNHWWPNSSMRGVGNGTDNTSSLCTQLFAWKEKHEKYFLSQLSDSIKLCCGYQDHWHNASSVECDFYAWWCSSNAGYLSKCDCKNQTGVSANVDKPFTAWKLFSQEIRWDQKWISYVARLHC